MNLQDRINGKIEGIIIRLPTHSTAVFGDEGLKLLDGILADEYSRGYSHAETKTPLYMFVGGIILGTLLGTFCGYRIASEASPEPNPIYKSE